MTATGEALRANQQPHGQRDHGGQTKDRVVDPLVREDEGKERQNRCGRQCDPGFETGLRRRVICVRAEEATEQACGQARRADQQQRQQRQVDQCRRVRARSEEPDKRRGDHVVERRLTIAGSNDARDPVERGVRQDIGDAKGAHQVDRRVHDGITVVLPQPDGCGYRLEKPQKSQQRPGSGDCWPPSCR